MLATGNRLEADVSMKRRGVGKKSRQKLRPIFLGVIMLGLILAVGGWFLSAPKGSGEVSLKIESNDNVHEVAVKLYDAGLIRSEQTFNWYTRFSGADRSLIAGDYQIPRGTSLPSLVQVFTEGRVACNSVTIPEGLTVRETVDLLAAKNLVNKERFMIAAQAVEWPFLKGLPQVPERLEGFLFPATYCFPVTADEQMVINTLLQRFNQELTVETQQRMAELGLTPLELVTIASLIEKEAERDDERPMIAGVIWNRLRTGMRLQIDATVLYALGGHKERLLYRDLEIESPYNTYRQVGLPPGPIASPGAASMRAALYPVKHDYLYYVARPDGSHVFSRSFDEHVKAKQKIQRGGE